MLSRLFHAGDEAGEEDDGGETARTNGVVLVSHRLSAVRWADRIVVVQHPGSEDSKQWGPYPANRMYGVMLLQVNAPPPDRPRSSPRPPKISSVQVKLHVSTRGGLRQADLVG